jgi:hypothetical protein
MCARQLQHTANEPQDLVSGFGINGCDGINDLTFSSSVVAGRIDGEPAAAAAAAVAGVLDKTTDSVVARRCAQTDGDFETEAVEGAAFFCNDGYW